MSFCGLDWFECMATNVSFPACFLKSMVMLFAPMPIVIYFQSRTFKILADILTVLQRVFLEGPNVV